MAEENFNWIENYYLPVRDQEALYSGKANELLNKNKIDNYQLIGIDQEPGAGEVQLNYKDEKQKQEDGFSFAEGLVDFVKDLPKDTVLSFAQAGVNGADVAVNLVPIFDKYFAATNPLYKSNDHLKYKMKDWSDALDGVRKDLKNKQAENNKASQFVSYIFQDIPYAVPIYRKMKSLGTPNWVALPVSAGVGFSLGFDEEASFFVNSEGLKNFKELVRVLPDTPEEKIFDNTVQALEGTGFAFAIPAIAKGFTFAKQNLPKLVTKETVSDAAKLAAGGTVIGTALTKEAKSGEKDFSDEEMLKRVEDAKKMVKEKGISFEEASNITQSDSYTPSDNLGSNSISKQTKKE